MSSRKSYYEIRELDLSPEGLEGASALLRAVFPRATWLTPAYLDWKYNRNPSGPAIGYEAWERGRLVGHYAMVPTPLRLFGSEVRGALILNLAVRAECQGRGVMSELGRRSHERARELGIACAWGVANRNSTHGHHRTFGFQWVCALDARVGLGALPRPRAAPEPHFERVWTDETLRWRLDNPSARYRLRSVGGRCEVHADAGIPGLRVVLGTLERPPGAASRASALWPRLWLGSDASLAWSGAAYLNLPARLRASPLNVVFKDLGGSRELAPSRLRIGGLDFDAY